MTNNKTALITGASRGLGYALATTLAHNGWDLLITARDKRRLHEAKRNLDQFTTVIALAGDIRDEDHLAEVSGKLKNHLWQLDLVVSNASALGPSPMPLLLEHPIENLLEVIHTNMIAPISLLQKVKQYLLKGAKVIHVTSDAAVEPYETWGGYGGSKAGLEHMTTILAKEYPEYYFYSFDPGDMQTDMHQAAFPGENISHLPLPEDQAVPAMIRIIEEDYPNGRYSISELMELQS